MYKNVNIVYQLARHGIAHSFIAKEGIVITKDDRANHLVIDTRTNQLVIDSTQFCEDFIASYENKIKPVVQGSSVDTIDILS